MNSKFRNTRAEDRKNHLAKGRNWINYKFFKEFSLKPINIWAK